MHMAFVSECFVQGAARAFVCLHKPMAAPGLFSRGTDRLKPPAAPGTPGFYTVGNNIIPGS